MTTKATADTASTIGKLDQPLTLAGMVNAVMSATETGVLALNAVVAERAAVTSRLLQAVCGEQRQAAVVLGTGYL